MEFLSKIMKSVLSRSGYPLVLIVGLSISACGGGLPFPGLTVEEVYNLGVGALEEENWGDAARAFEEVLLSTGFDRMPEARLQLAEAHFGGGRYIAARTEYQRLIDRWPADTTAVHAALGVCRSLKELSPIPQRDQTFTRQAEITCGQVAAQFAGTVIGLRASELSDEMVNRLAERDYNTGSHYLKRGLIDSALLYYEQVVELFPDSEWAPWALYRMIEAFEMIGYVRDVETTQELLLGSYPESEPAQMLENGGQ
ncbi:MAG: hypothetical protein CME29_01690 [Gemmatimonadetes bacterium]|nr:hypothetical protein [Gemmatimonadota bacterium]|tara:strand:+ start:2062 stop:2826 length:765 start_codon:yes stop_codon:yes gene_type:complete